MDPPLSFTLSPMMITYWFLLGGDAISTFVAVASLFEGVRLLSSKGVSRKAVLTACFGVILCVALAGVHFAKYRGVTSAIEVVELPTIPDKIPPSSEWSTSLTPIERETIGRKIASAKYQHSGTITAYADRAQQNMVFIPTQKEAQDREQIVARLAVLRELQSARFGDTMRWLFWIGLAVIFGVAVGRTSRNVR